MAARAWFAGTLDARRRPPDPEAVAEAEALGLTAGQAEAMLAARDAAEASRAGAPSGPALPGPRASFDGVWPWHANAVTAFLAAASQWRFNGTLAAGLDYAGAAIAWAAFGIELDANDFSRLQILEGEARRLLNGASTGSA